ncbi:50S ribosomal protein L13 [Mycoplasmatota bacterium]|nr:50S ribosomal protein L13 [Mycoplasmatota bacterium]
MKTFMQTKESVQRNWHVIDATGKTLGRLSTEAAVLLRGKHKPTFTPHIDGGDYVIIVNAEKIELTGNKLNGKLYRKHSGWIGGLKTKTAREMRENHPVKMLELSIHGMLPKGRLGRQMCKKLFVYKGESHPHAAQQPKEYVLKG